MLRIQGRLISHACSRTPITRQILFERSHALTAQCITRQLSMCSVKASSYKCQLALKRVGSVPKRNLASKFDSNYILEHNSLSEAEKKEIKEAVDKDYEDWVPYGMCPNDKEEDIYRYKMLMVAAITLGFVTFTYIYVHMPHPRKKDWALREAYLELERRQQLGLPLVDKNLIPEDKVLLPELEELGDDYEIII